LTASEKARLTSNPVVIGSPLVAAAVVAEGEDVVFVQAKPADMDGGMPKDVEQRLAAGEVFVPPQLLLQGGDFIMVGSDVSADLAFVCKVIPGEDCERPADQYQVILDRPFLLSHAEGSFITKQKATEEHRAQFYRPSSQRRRARPSPPSASAPPRRASCTAPSSAASRAPSRSTRT
jgi:hypothetical protein